MDAPVTLRLDGETRRRIARIAERRRISKSEVIRRALKSWSELHESDMPPYEALKDLIGTVHGQDPKRSENAGRKFARMVQEKRAKP